MAAPTPQAIYQAQQTLTRRLVLALVPILRPLLGTKRTKELSATITAAVFPYVQSGRLQSTQLARAVYVESKKAWDEDAAPIPNPGIREYAPEALEAAISKTLEQNDSETIEEEDLERVATVADLHTRNAYRNNMIAHSMNDDDIRGWARVDPVPPTCELCRLLISRGPVYTSAASAGGRNKFHTGCTCVPQLVFKGQDDWPGKDLYLAELARYKKATQGKSGKDARKAWRDAVNTANSASSVQAREAEEQSRKTPRVTG